MDTLKKDLQEKINHLKTLILVSEIQDSKENLEVPRRRFSIGNDHSLQFATPRKLNNSESAFFREKFVEQQCQSIKFKCTINFCFLFIYLTSFS